MDQVLDFSLKKRQLMSQANNNSTFAAISQSLQLDPQQILQASQALSGLLGQHYGNSHMKEEHEEQSSPLATSTMSPSSGSSPGLHHTNPSPHHHVTSPMVPQTTAFNHSLLSPLMAQAAMNSSAFAAAAASLGPLFSSNPSLYPAVSMMSSLNSGNETLSSLLTATSPTRTLTMPTAHRRRRMTSSLDSDSNDGHADSSGILGKRPQGTVPEENKDELYWERRKKNNEAAKRSRDLRRQKEEDVAMRAAYLEQENLKLKAQVSILKNETTKLHCLLFSQVRPAE